MNAMTEPTQKSPFWQAMSMAWELGYTIAIPLVVFALAGRFLDRQLGTTPWLLLAGMIIAIVVSTLGLIRKFNKIIAAQQRTDTTKKN